MNDKKERVYSEEDLCEYTILQKIDELEKQLKNIKNEFNGMYETKEAADAIHRLLRSNDAKINNRIDGLYNITPTDIGVKDNKLGLLHDTTWLTNQGAINIGNGLTYDEATKTLKASGGGVEIKSTSVDISVNATSYNVGDYVFGKVRASTYGASKIYIVSIGLLGGSLGFNINGDCKFIPVYYNEKLFNEYSVIALVCIKSGTVSSNATIQIEADFILK